MNWEVTTKVTTSDGATATFYKDGGEYRVLLWIGTFHNNIVDPKSIKLEKGKRLRFNYYSGVSLEKIASKYPVVSIEEE